VWALIAAAASCLVASAWSVMHLLTVHGSVRYDPSRLRRALRDGVPVAHLARLWQRENDCAEGAIVEAVAGAADLDGARRAVNEALLDLDGQLPRETPVRATCLRVTLLGTVLGVALLVASRQAATVALLDVLAVGGASAMVAWTASSEVQRMVERRREELDGLVDDLMASRWGAGWAVGQERYTRAVQAREPRRRRSVDGLAR